LDPGENYQSGDVWDPDKPMRQLVLAAKGPQHEVLYFWQGTQGGPMLVVMIIEYGTPKPRLIFNALMHKDIPPTTWTWAEIKRHILENRMDVLISAEHPGTYDNR